MSSYPPIVFLAEPQRETARACARTMLESARRHGYHDRFGEASSRSHYIGALGELAFAIFLGRPWECHPKDVGGRPDVGGYEVRTVGPDVREMYVKSKANDRPDTRIVAVAILAGRDADDVISREAAAFIHGWISAAQLREHGRLGDPGNRGAPGWFLTDLRRLSREWR